MVKLFDVADVRAGVDAVRDLEEAGLELADEVVPVELPE